MEGFFTLLVGIAIGGLLMWLNYSIREYWKQSKDLRSSSAKARKEVQEKQIKARVDAQKARGAVFGAGLRVFFLVSAIVFTSFAIWLIANL